MKLVEKLQLIQKISGLTQTEIANKIGVSFTAFNNWWTGKATPRAKRLLIIDDLYKELTGQAIIPEEVLEAKKQIILKESKKYKNIVKTIISSPDIYNQLILSLTYNSNRIEGSTLSEGETADIMFNNRALPNKSLIEQLEVKNHQTALNFLFNYLKTNKKIDKELILKLHSILLSGIRDDAGFFRNHGVRIVASNVPTANYIKIPNLIENLVNDINKVEKDIISLTSKNHAIFEQIHPFSDGNGRLGRLIMLAMLVRKNIAPAVVQQEKKYKYYASLNKAQLKNDFSQLEDFICESIFFAFKIINREE